MDIENAILDLDEEIVDHEKIKTTDRTTGFDKVNPNLEDFPVNLKKFYQTLDWFKIFWETNEEIIDGSKIYGYINILPSAEVLHDWKGVVYFDGDPADRANFKIVDFFLDEVCVGYYHDERKSDAMYIFNFEGEPEPLGVNFAGYLELLLMARGFNGWQRVLQNLNGESVHQSDFKIYMPQLFPDFKWEEFVGLYERVKLR